MPRGPVRLIGLDAAVDPRNNALSRGELRWTADGAPTLCVEELVAPRNEDELHRTLVGWVLPGSTVLCVDSPLGWPAELGSRLSAHVAGAELPGEPNDLFRRITDRDIHQRLGKTPLDVGADRIARTAHRTLARLARIGEAWNRDGRDTPSCTITVPLTRPELTEIGVTRPELTNIGEAGPGGAGGGVPDPRAVFLLETYPAGWFASERIDTRGYRPLPAVARRQALWETVLATTTRVQLPTLNVDPGGAAATKPGTDPEAICRRADELDSVVCLLVGAEALLGRAPGAVDLFGEDIIPRIRREGWIWCKSPE
jgi:hypothetical protein